MLGRTLALGLPEPVVVEVLITRRGIASPSLFVDGLEGADAAAVESAEVATLAVLAGYHELYSRLLAHRKEPLEACPEVWTAAQHLSIKVRGIAMAWDGMRMAVASCCDHLPMPSRSAVSAAP